MASPLATNIISFWKLDESSGNASDSVASNTLTNNNTVGYVSGLVNNAADFGTANTNKSFSRAGAMTATSYSYSIWVKMRTEITSGTQCFLTWSGVSTNVSLELYYEYNSGSPRISVRRSSNGVGFDFVYLNGALGTTNWHHIVVTWTASTLTAYKNGTSATPVTSSSTGSVAVTAGFALGAEWNYTGGALSIYASCYIDAVGIWSRVLAQSDVDLLYRIGLGQQYPFPYYVTTTTETSTGTEALTIYRGKTTITSETATGDETLGIIAPSNTKWTNQSKSSATWTNQSKN